MNLSRYINLNVIVIIMFLIIILLFVLVIFLNCKINKVNKKYQEFMEGKDAVTLEDTIKEAYRQIDDLTLNDREREIENARVINGMINTIQKVGIVKYDAFKEMGGKLSFTIALLNAENTGFVLNIMHSPEACYTYIKEIIKGESYIALGVEEKEALDKAMYIQE